MGTRWTWFATLGIYTYTHAAGRQFQFPLMPSTSSLEPKQTGSFGSSIWCGPKPGDSQLQCPSWNCDRKTMTMSGLYAKWCLVDSCNGRVDPVSQQPAIVVLNPRNATPQDEWFNVAPKKTTHLWVHTQQPPPLPTKSLRCDAKDWEEWNGCSKGLQAAGRWSYVGKN